MKKIFIFVILINFFLIKATAQTPYWQIQTSWEFDNVKAKNGITIPRTNILRAPYTNKDSVGLFLYLNQDNKIYYKNIFGYRALVEQDSLLKRWDSTLTKQQIQSAIDNITGYVKYTDTIIMLAPYARKTYVDSSRSTDNLPTVLARGNHAENSNIIIGSEESTDPHFYEVQQQVGVAGAFARFGISEGATAGAMMRSIGNGGVATVNLSPAPGIGSGISFNSNGTGGTIWHALVDTAGSLFNPTYSGATVISNIHTTSKGRVLAIGSRNLTAADINAEAIANKSTNTALGTSNIQYPTQNAVKTYVDGAITAIPIPTLQQVLQAGSTAANSITLGANGNTNSYSLSLIRNMGAVNYTTSLGLGLATTGLDIRVSNGTAAADKVMAIPHGGTTITYSPDNGTNNYSVWHSGNHPAGSAFNVTLSGATVPATFVTNAAGHLAGFSTRNMTPGDITAVPETPSTASWSGFLGATTARFISSATGAPNGNPWYGIHIPGDANNSAQIAIRDGNFQFRGYTAGVATAWTQLAPASGAAGYIQNGTSKQASSNFNISGSGIAGVFATESAIGSAASIMRNASGVIRWSLGMTNAETGSGNVGADYNLWRYNDAGTLIGTAFSINRSTGDASFFGSLGNIALTSGADIRMSRAAANYITAGDASGSFIIRTGGDNNRLLISSAGDISLLGAVTASSSVTANEMRAPLLVSNSSAGSVSVVGGATTVGSSRGGEVITYGGTHATVPGGITFHAGAASGGTTQTERMRIANNGTVTIPGILNMGNASRVIGTSTGAANVATLGFYESNGTTSVGSIGDNSAGNNSLYLTANTGNLELSSIGSNTDININAARYVVLNNSTKNVLYYNGAGVGVPTFTTSSAGTKIIFSPAISGSSVDFADGIESNARWSSVPTAASFFKWYAGITNVATMTGDGSLHLSGGVRVATRTVTAGTTALGDDYTILVNNAAAATVSLPSAADSPGQIYTIKKISNNAFAVSVDPAGGELIEGSSTPYALITYLSSISIQSDGTSWWVFAHN